MDNEQKRDIMAEISPEALLADGFEDAFVGYVEIASKVIALYDRKKCIAVLMVRDGMDEDEAHEFFEFNVVGAYVGEHTPGFAVLFDDIEVLPEGPVEADGEAESGEAERD